MQSFIRYVSMEALLKADSEGLNRLTKFWIRNLGCSKALPQGISITCSQSASCCGWMDRSGGISEYSKAKWNERKVAKKLPWLLDMVLCTQDRASM